MTDKEKILQIIGESLKVKQTLSEDSEMGLLLMKTVHAVSDCFKNGGKLLIFGNGGSASDSQHIAAELSGRFKLNRKALHAEALHTNSSYLTAVANDYGFNEIYARLIEGIANPRDIVLGLSTSGNSENVIQGLTMARSKNIQTLGWTGKDGGKLKHWCDICLQAPSNDTARIQEVHILWGHILCEMVEQKLFGE